MTPHEYQLETRRTRPAGESRERALAHYALGLCEEAGELAGVVKKHVFYGHPLDRDKLVKEAGDVFWYLASLLDTAGVGLSRAIESQENRILDKRDGLPMVRSALDLAFHASRCEEYATRANSSTAEYADGWRDSLKASASFVITRLREIVAVADVRLDEVMAANVRKLRARYPQGWTAADAAERKDEGTRAPRRLTELEAELLEACEEALRTLDFGRPCEHPDIEAFRPRLMAAIAKAKGEA